jgi:hypothetical protein
MYHPAAPGVAQRLSSDFFIARCGFESRLRLSMRLSTILVAIGIGLAATGCSGGDDDEQANPETQPVQGRPVPKLVEATVVEGGSARERSLLRSAVAGMEKTSLQQITIGPVATRRETDGGGKAIAITFRTIPAATIRRQWDEWIVAGAFSRRLLAAGLPAEVDAEDSHGGFTAQPRLKGKPDPRPLANDREAAIVKALRNAGKKAKAEAVAVQVHRPYGVAIALSLAPEDTVAFLRTQLRPFLESLDAHRPRLEGVYVAVLDEDRRLALEWGSWTRNPAGVYWVRRDLANCSPIRQTEPPGTEKPPACPA